MPGQKNKPNYFSPNEELEKRSREKSRKPRKQESQKPLEFSTSLFNREVFELRGAREKLQIEEKQETRKKLAEIRQELEILIKSLSILKKETEKAIKENVVDPGIYHELFLDQLKATILFLRLRTEESISWLQTLTGRKKRKGHYWANAKKKGSSYILSGERTSATRTL